MNQEAEGRGGGVGAPPRSGLVQRKVDTLKSALNGTFEVYNLVSIL
jgi:hypothetical protein